LKAVGGRKKRPDKSDYSSRLFLDPDRGAFKAVGAEFF
jgi:hypothetical protein